MPTQADGTWHVPAGLPGEAAEVFRAIERIKPQQRWVTFRGESSCFLSMHPSVGRIVKCRDEQEAKRWERHIDRRFREEAWHLLPEPIRARPDDELSRLFVMQHYRVPTRMLDWTDSPWIALYFACESRSSPETWKSPSSPEDQCGRIRWVSRKAVTDAADNRYRPFTSVWPHTDWRKWLWGESEDHIHAHRWLVFMDTLGVSRFPRQLVQQSRMTIARTARVCHWTIIQDLLSAREDEAYGEILVPDGVKPACLWQLRRMGICASTLFPDIEGVVRELGVIAQYSDQEIQKRDADGA